MAAAAAAAGPASELLHQGPFGAQPPREPSPEPPRPPRSPWGPPSDLGRLLRSLSAPSGRAVPPPPGFAPRCHGAPPGLARPTAPGADLDRALLALAALSLGPDPPRAGGALPLPPPLFRAASLGPAPPSPMPHGAAPPLSPFGSPPRCRSPSPPSSPPSPLYKTELCRPFTATGRCRYGARCQFAHGPEELRGLRRHPKYRTQPCSTFQRCGACPYGSRCHFLHGPAPPAAPGSPRRLPVFDRISVSE